MGDMADCAVGEISCMLKVLPVKTMSTHCLLLNTYDSRLTSHYSLLTTHPKVLPVKAMYSALGGREFVLAQVSQW